MSGTTLAQSSFDKGLRGSIAEQLATISKLSQLFEENPVPTFVNSMLLRVADAFKDGSLDLRVAIARTLGQCGSHLTLAFSSAEIFRRILTVSHSNDPNARETVLDVLAELSPLLPESNQSHHLIRESLSTTHEAEFRATCHALKSFASISHSFAEAIVLQIGKILEDDDTAEARKVQLCSAFSTMSATAHVVEQVFGIAEKVLRRTISDEYFHAFLNSTTSLCIETRYAISKQINVLLGLLCSPEKDEYFSSKTRRLVVIRELKRLSNFPNIWTEKQVKTFVGSLQSSMTDCALIYFFDATTSLVKNSSEENFLSLKSLVVSSTGYGSMPNPEVSVRFVYFASKVLCSPRAFKNVSREFIESTMTSLTVVVVNTCTCGKLRSGLAKRLFRAVGDLLLAFPYTQYTFSPMIISAVFSAFDSPAVNDQNQRERLELLCRLVDSEKLYIPEIHKWACEVRRERAYLFSAYPSQFSYICLSVGTNPPTDSSTVFYKECPVSMYETARSAFRNGQWKQVAYPNLSGINVIKLPQFERSWITALREIADSQLLELGLDELDNQQAHLSSALSILKSGKMNTRFESSLRFPIGMVSAMLASSHAHFHILSVIRPFYTHLSGALQLNSFFNPVVAQRFLTAMSSCESSLSEALSEWSALCRACFCADSTSFDLITLFYLRVSVLLVAVRVILKKQSPDTVIQIPPFSSTRTCSLLQRERLQWTIEKIPTLKYDDSPNIYTIRALYNILEQLAIIPYMLPRFFFQQFYHVDFKISTTPQAEKDNSVSVISGETVPVRIDGAITSTHPSPIRSIIVFAEITHLTNHSPNHVLKEVVDHSENNYFTAQFLLSFTAPCEVKFRIEFIDQTSRKQWKADGGAILPITIREKYSSNLYDPKRNTTKMPLDPKPFIRGPMFGVDA